MERILISKEEKDFGERRSTKKSQRHQGFIREKGRVIKEEREASRLHQISGNGGRADIHGVPGALNRVVGVLIIAAEHKPRDARPVTIQSNSLNKQGDSRYCALCQRQINL
uniref:Uncharacterized protein n=1 Tax=Fagus sylvatica TaxID=28930 RepID=A0A2N9IXA9_FAGSY